MEACRVINGAKCDMSFEVHGTQGAMKWNMERMNELQLQWRNDENPAEDGYTTRSTRAMSFPASSSRI
ncbi:MAG TPA: hypothetical protein VF177_14280 [Anaerolineae bacterium]